MYFSNVDADYQDRDLELGAEAVNLTKVIEEQEALVNERSFTNGDLLIRPILFPSTMKQGDITAPPKLSHTNLPDENASVSNVVNIFRSSNPEPSSKPMPINDMPVSAAPVKVAPSLQQNPLITRIDALFSNFIGMSHLKEEVYRQASFIKIQQMRKEKNIAVAASPSRHMVFKGNPGTGKTTVARIIADVYYELGVLDTNNVVETDRSGLVAEYLGQTAVKTREVIESALDGVLFIDEAYSLTEQENNDYGIEAIDTLVKMMEDHRDNLVVIVAGYGEEMDRFISSNPGLKSRFNRYMDFPNYSVEELWEILLKLCKANSYIIQGQTQLKSRMLQQFQLHMVEQGSHFGNARYVRNLFEKAIENQSYRLIMESATDHVSLQVLKQCDFIAG